MENPLPLSPPSALTSLSTFTSAQFLTTLRLCSPAPLPMSRDPLQTKSSMCVVSVNPSRLPWAKHATNHEENQILAPLHLPPSPHRHQLSTVVLRTSWPLPENQPSVPHLYEPSAIAKNHRVTLLTAVPHRSAACLYGEPPSSEPLRLDLPQMSPPPAGATYPPSRPTSSSAFH
jgi:hypothetical protein